MDNIRLDRAPSKKTLKVIAIDAGQDVKRRLNAIGIHIDDILVKLNNNRWGPILVRNDSNKVAKLAIGRGLAQKIDVEML